MSIVHLLFSDLDLYNLCLLLRHNYHHLKLENKTVIVEEFQDKETALQIVEQSIVDYKAKFI